MPRRRRSDAPGAFHHIYVRGIERRDLFLDDLDRRVYLDWLARAIPEAGASCHAWALLCNHAHLLLRTGHQPTSAVMHRVGTGYGLHFNRRYGRDGYVFQGRYGARSITGDGDCVTVLRYVHRNPIEAGVVADVEALARYPWSGHAPLMGSQPVPAFQAASEVLRLFDPDPRAARARLVEWMGERDRLEAPIDDADLESLIASVCAEIGVNELDVRSGRRSRAANLARLLIARRATRELGIGTAPVARALGITRQALWKRLGDAGTGRQVDTNARHQVDVTPAGRGGRSG